MELRVHVLDHYGNYAGAVTPAEDMSSAAVVRRQVTLTGDHRTRLTVARSLVAATAANVRWALDTTLLDEPTGRLGAQLEECGDTMKVMGAEGNFRRTAWEVLDTILPPWLRLAGRSRRPPANAGNAFISYANSIVYSRVLTSLRCTPLHPAIGFLHADTDRRRNTLALDLAEPFKPLFAERLLKRLAARRSSRRPTSNPAQARPRSPSQAARKSPRPSAPNSLSPSITAACAGKSPTKNSSTWKP